MLIDSLNHTYVYVNGIFGSFQSLGSEVKLNYMLSVANSYAPGHSDMLQLLKPLREYVDINSLNSLDEILQRDIDDSRVADKIVDYLAKGIKSRPTFFPSIVVVLLPADTFADAATQYPTAKREIKNGRVCADYGGLWKYELFQDPDGNTTNLGTLGLRSGKNSGVIPLVIDGQHRAAAFRFMTGYANFEGENKIYETFYRQKLSFQGGEEFKSDLPVTYVWFESTDENNAQIESVNDFSRKLFVDINQSSQMISKSRKMLLADDDPCGFLTRSFYNQLAERGFQRENRVNLYSAGFDYPYDLSGKKGWSPTSIFVPELLSYALEYLLFSEDWVNRDLHKFKVEENKRENKSTFEKHIGFESFSHFISETLSIEKEKKQSVSQVKEVRDELNEAFRNRVGVHLMEIIDECGLYMMMMQASEKLELIYAGNGVESSGDSLARSTWKEVFCGGTGLYYTLKYSKNDSAVDYQLAIRKIESKYFAELSELTGLTTKESEDLSKLVKTVAFFVGFIMAYDFYVFRYGVSRQEIDVDEVRETYKELIADIDWVDFSKFVLRLKTNSNYLSTIDPKHWPAYRNVILRYIYEIQKSKGGKTVYETFARDSLERSIYIKELRVAVNSFADDKGANKRQLVQKAIKQGNWGDDSITEEEFKLLQSQVKLKVRSCFEREGDNVGTSVLEYNEGFMIGYS